MVLESELVALVEDLPGAPPEGVAVGRVKVAGHAAHVALLLDQRQLTGDRVPQRQSLLLQNSHAIGVLLICYQDTLLSWTGETVSKIK